MKKISLFSFLAAALLCVGQNAMAQTTIFHWQSNGNTPTAGTEIAATGGNIMPGTSDANKTFSVESASYAASVTDDMKALNSAKGVKFGANALSFTISLLNDETFKAGDIVYISGYNTFKISSTTDLSGDIATSLTTGTSKIDYQVGSVTLSNDTKTIILTRATSSGTCVGAIKIVRPAPKTEPWISVTPAEVNLDVNPFAKSVEASVAIKGGNLTDGTYNLTLPEVAGLSIAPASVTVSDGALDATLTLTYTSETNVEAATAEVALTIDELTEKLTINYSANVDLLVQTTVSENTVWDWSQAGTGSIVLTDNSTPSKADTLVLANIDGIANEANFNSQALLVSGEYMIRDGKLFQGNYISFNVAKKGFVTVEFSNTGNRSNADTETRYLYINGNKTNFGSLTTTANTISDAIAVEAGKVEITFMLPAEEKNEHARVYKITYTIDDTPTSFEQAAVSEKVVKVVRDGQLYILRDGKTYNAQGIVVE